MVVQRQLALSVLDSHGFVGLGPFVLCVGRAKKSSANQNPTTLTHLKTRLKNACRAWRVSSSTAVRLMGAAILAAGG